MAQLRSPRQVDIATLAREAGRLDGIEALGSLARLGEAVLDVASAPPVRWSAKAHLRKTASGLSPWLDLVVDAEMTLECQRCLSPLVWKSHIERAFRFVPTEAQAEEEDAQSEEDVLSLVKRLDLVELIEDELLLDIPLVPRHDVCPPDRKAPMGTVTEASGTLEPATRRPFAALSRLKQL